jgi:tRNA(fMet)-specific endonuclease VapC
MPYLLDTNICIDYMRGRNAKLKAQMESQSPDDLRICSVVLGELLRGAFKSKDARSNIEVIDV